MPHFANIPIFHRSFPKYTVKQFWAGAILPSKWKEKFTKKRKKIKKNKKKMKKIKKRKNENIKKWKKSKK